MKLSPTSSPFFFTFHCRIIYYEAQTYFILTSILMPAQNIFSSSLSETVFFVYDLYAFMRPLFQHLCVPQESSRVRLLNYGKRFFLVLTLVWLQKWIDVLFISTQMGSFASLIHCCAVYSHAIFASIYYSINAIL